jgi:hypothetical protein
MGQLDSNVQSPTSNEGSPPAGSGVFFLDVALQVAFERRILKPVFHLIDYRLWV